MSARDRGWKTPPEKTMVMTLEGISRCIGDPIPIEGPDHVLGEMEPIARQRRDAEMLEFWEIFRVISKNPLQTLLLTMII